MAVAVTTQRFDRENRHLLFLCAIYGIAYYLLFQAVDTMIGLAGFSLWFPAAGLRFALIFAFGWRFGLIAAAIEIAVQGLLGEWAHWHYSPIFIVLGISAPPLIYSMIMGAFRRKNLISIYFQQYHHAIWFVLAAIIIPAITAPVSTALQILGNRLPASTFLDASLSFWVGDMVGILMVAPVAILAFSLSQPDNSRPPNFGSALAGKSFWAEFGALTAVTAILVFGAPGFLMTVKGFPFLLPLLWMSLRFGFKGSALAVFMVNLMVVPVVVQLGTEIRTEHQILLALLSATALIIGGLVTSKQHIESQLISSAHHDRLNVMGDMASQIIHELAQPTSITAMYAKESARLLANGQHSPDQIKEAMDRIAVQTERLNNLIGNMKQFAAKGELSPRLTDTHTVINGARDLIDIFAKNFGVQVRYDLPSPLPIFVDGILLQQAIINLAKNGIEAMTASETKLLTISAQQSATTVDISVADTGPGLPVNYQEGQSSKIDGMGLGLKITRGIADAHDGKLVWVTKNEAVIKLPIPRKRAPLT